LGDGNRGAAIAPVAKTITPREPPKTETRDVAALIFDLNPRSGIISPQKVYDWDGNENNGLPDAPFTPSVNTSRWVDKASVIAPHRT
jgi:hypothetical protein